MTRWLRYRDAHNKMAQEKRYQDTHDKLVRYFVS